MPPKRQHSWVDLDVRELDLPGDVAEKKYLRSCGKAYAKQEHLAVARWSQPTVRGDALRMTCRCNQHRACERFYEFTGLTTERSYRLTVRSSGSCGGEAKAARKPPEGAKHAASVQEIAAAKAKVEDLLQKDGVFPAPNTVKRELGQRWVSSRAKLKGVVRRVREKKGIKIAKSRRKKRLPAGSLQDFIAPRRTFEDTMFFMSVSLTILSYTVFLTPLLLAVQRLNPTKLIITADCTFKVDWEGYVWGFVGLVCHRMLVRRWRRSFLPIMMVCHPREDKQIWSKALADLAQELHRRDLPAPRKLHSDWRKEVPSAFQAAFPDGKLVQGLEHMARALRRNRSKLGGDRKIEYVISCLYTFAYLPMHLFFSEAMNVFLCRMRYVWASPHFVDYLEAEYVRREGDVVRASWHHGAFREDFDRGAPPSQQIIESWNRKFKADVLDRLPKSEVDHTTVLRRVEACLPLWARKLEQDEAEPYSLLALPGLQTACSGPDCPDAWMLETSGTVVKPPGGQSMFVASIKSILEHHAADSETIFKKRRRDRTLYVLRIGAPQKITCGEDMIRQIQVTSQQELRERWLASGILLEPADGCADAKYKISMDAVRSQWLQHCLVIAIDREPGTPKTLRASCWHYAHHGHCPHYYAVEELEQVRRHIQAATPLASSGQAALKQGALPVYDRAGSSEGEDEPRRRAKRVARVSVPRVRKKEKRQPSRSRTPGRSRRPSRSRTPGSEAPPAAEVQPR